MKLDIKGVIIPNEDKWIYDWFEMDSCCPREVHAALAKASGEPVDVYINSGGGEITSGSEIYAALQSYEGELFIHIVGLAGSAASIIACAGHCDIVTTGLYMMHCVSGGSRGNKFGADVQRGILEVADRAFASAYVQKTGKSEAEILELMEKDRGEGTWLTAQEAVQGGFIDKVAEARMVASATAAFGGDVIPQGTIEKLKALIKKPPESNPNGQEDSKNERELRARLKLMKLGGQINE